MTNADRPNDSCRRERFMKEESERLDFETHRRLALAKESNWKQQRKRKRQSKARNEVRHLFFCSWLESEGQAGKKETVNLSIGLSCCSVSRVEGEPRNFIRIGFSLET